MSRKQERSQKAFSSAITLAATNYPHSFDEAGLAHVALLLPVLNFPCKRNLFHYGTSGVCLPLFATRQKRVGHPPKTCWPTARKDSRYLFANPKQVACPDGPFVIRTGFLDRELTRRIYCLNERNAQAGGDTKRNRKSLLTLRRSAM